MGSPSVYVLLLLVNEQSCFGLHQNRIKWEFQADRGGERRWSQGDIMKLLKETDTWKHSWQTTSLMVKYKIIEMGNLSYNS